MESAMFAGRSRKSLLGTRRGLRSFVVEDLPPPPVFDEEPQITTKSPDEDQSTILEDKSEESTNSRPRKSVVCALFNNDSFEDNETMLANSSGNETILASTLLMTTKKDDESLFQVLDVIKLLLKKNTDALKNTFEERAILKNIKKNLMETHNIRDFQSRKSKSPSKEEIYAKYGISSECNNVKIRIMDKF